MIIKFIGAIDGVTGSKTLLQTQNDLILIDCGLYQTGESFSEKNYESLSFDPKKLTAIFISHAHLDHTGLLPYIYKEGYRGPIFLTHPTSKLTRIILDDSAELIKNQEDPLYSSSDAKNVISLFRPINFNSQNSHNDLIFTFYKASHILGAAHINFLIEGKSITFSGDVGRLDEPLLGPPSPLANTDFLITESTSIGRIRAIIP